MMKHKPNRTGKLLETGQGTGAAGGRLASLRQTGNSDTMSRKWMGETKFRESKFVRRGPEADPSEVLRGGGVGTELILKCRTRCAAAT
jgi:hypothetical protein